MLTILFLVWVGLVIHGYYRYKNPKRKWDKELGPIGILLGGFLFWVWVFFLVVRFL